MKVDGVAARGERPLLVVLVEYPGISFRAPHTRDFYDRLFFGTSNPADLNVAAYTRDISSGAFMWTKLGAGVVGPIRYPAGAPMTAPAIRAKAIELAGAAGWRSDGLDINGDGQISGGELGVVVISAAPAPSVGAQTGPMASSCTTPIGSAKPVCMQVSAVGEGVSLATATHELAHQLGAYDVYGAAFRLNRNVSVMAATIARDEDDRQVFHLDPWHKLRLGWIKPRIYAITDPGASARLGTIAGRLNSEPVILYDPRRGRHEFFILEYRTPSVGLYDANLGDWRGGVAIWQVKTEGDHRLPIIRGSIRPGTDRVLQSIRAGDDVIRPVDNDGDGVFDEQQIWLGANDMLDSTLLGDDVFGEDFTNWVVGSPPDIIDAGFRGQSTLWRAEHGEVTSVHWLDGSPVGLRLRVGAPAPRDAFPAIDVEWRTSAAAPPTRIDLLNTGAGLAGSEITVTGDFGIERGSKIVSLWQKFGGRDLEVLSWTATTLRVRAPLDTPPGVYHVVVFDNAARTTSSNGLLFTVTR
jgi:M6 family metalloprotease-like protein